MDRAVIRPARDVADFLADPQGRYSVGGTHLVWCHSPTLCGTAHWGRPDERDAAELVHRLDFSRHPTLARSYDVFMDASRMQLFSWQAFGVVSRYAQARLPELCQRIRRHAIVVPPGVTGALVAGLIPLLNPAHALRFFSSANEALDWLGRVELVAVSQEVALVAGEQSGPTAVLRQLRAHLDRRLAVASVSSAARALGLSVRSLQRELRRQRTSFSIELARARVAAARAMLEHSDDKVEVIARRVGYVSSSQLCKIFQRLVAETPTRYRARSLGGELSRPA